MTWSWVHDRHGHPALDPEPGPPPPRVHPGVRGVRRLLVTVGALALLAGCGSPPDGPVQDMLLSQVSGQGAYGHLEQLQKIADANGGTRVAGSPGYDASVDYVVRVLQGAGYQVIVQTARIPLDGQRLSGPVSIRNVIAQTRTGNPDRVVMAGAHLDSVRAGPGINDNGSGVAGLLEIATRLGGSPQVANAVRFAFWDAEEEDDAGSLYYTKNLSSAERQKLMLYLNVDMLASPNGGYFVQGGTGKKESATGPPGSAEVARVVREQLAGVGAESAPDTFIAASDYEGFVDLGVPTAGVLTGDEDEKDADEVELWGGEAGAVYDACYHSRCDRITNIERTFLDNFTRAIAGTIGYFAGSGRALTG